MDSRIRWGIVALVVGSLLGSAAPASAALLVEQASYVEIGDKRYELRYRTGGDAAAERIDLFAPQGGGPASNIEANPAGAGDSMALGGDTAIRVDFFSPVTSGTNGTVRFTLPNALAADAKIGVVISNSSETSPVVDASRDTSQQPPPGGGGQPPPSGGGEPQPTPAGPNLAVSLTGPSSGGIFEPTAYTLSITNVGKGRSAGGTARLGGAGAQGGLGPLLGMSVSSDSPAFAPNACIEEQGFLQGGQGGEPIPPEERALDADLGTLTTPGLEEGQSISADVTLRHRGCEQFFPIARPTGAVRLRAILSPRDGPPGPDVANHETAFGAPRERTDSNLTSVGSGTIKATALKAIEGTASGAVARTDVAVLQLPTGVRKAGASCRSLSSARGRFTDVPVANGQCEGAVWLRAKGKKKWSFKLRKTLPKGRYAIYSRAIAANGVSETKWSARDRNRMSVRLR